MQYDGSKDVALLALVLFCDSLIKEALSFLPSKDETCSKSSKSRFLINIAAHEMSAYKNMQNLLWLAKEKHSCVAAKKIKHFHGSSPIIVSFTRKLRAVSY
jgi:hypothetical protein